MNKGNGDISIIDWSGIDLYPEENGVYINVDEALYHADEGRMSKHQLDTFARSPAHWLAERQGRRKHKKTDPMSWGSALDMLLTDEPRFIDVYVPGPDVSRVTKKWKAFETNLAAGQIGIKETDYKNILGARKALEAHSLAARYLFARGAHYQVTINWAWEVANYKIPMRSRLDAVLINSETICIVDLKRAEDARGEAFSKAIMNYRYHIQAACYIDALSRALHVHDNIDFVFVAVEPEPPHAIAVYRLDDFSYELGISMFNLALLDFARCAEQGSFPSYPEEVRTLQLPAFYLKAHNKLLEDII